MNWSEIFQSILKFLPRFEIVNPDEGGLFIRFGRLKKVIEPGICFCMPYFDELIKYTTSDANLFLPKQSINTKDGKSVVVSCSITYLLSDARIAILKTDDVTAMLRSEVSERVVEYISDHNYKSIKGNSFKKYIMQDSFIEYISDKWGILIKGFYLHDLIPHKAIRLIMNTDIHPKDDD